MTAKDESEGTKSHEELKGFGDIEWNPVAFNERTRSFGEAEAKDETGSSRGSTDGVEAEDESDFDEESHRPGAFRVSSSYTVRSTISTELSAIGPHTVQAELVDPMHEEAVRLQVEEETRQRFIAQAVLAKAVPEHKYRRVMLVGLLISMIVGLIVGLVLPFTRRDQSAEPPPDNELLASLSFWSTGRDAILEYAKAELRIVNDVAEVTTGTFGNVLCSVLPCVEDTSMSYVTITSHVAWHIGAQATLVIDESNFWPFPVEHGNVFISQITPQPAEGWMASN